MTASAVITKPAGRRIFKLDDRSAIDVYDA
ncbi:MAG: hypothetical protein M2R45_02791 [Verrucomicrobia subdivision 3 bacterium]|nr:hypothetical protein [Limisphaerales bacterium]MCS1414343.1 hypothetical protein [Limisphaerales bacterium]